MRTWRDRLLGSEDRRGWWLVPFFLVVGLAGAVLAGSLAVVYDGQQVDQLRGGRARRLGRARRGDGGVAAPAAACVSPGSRVDTTLLPTRTRCLGDGRRVAGRDDAATVRALVLTVVAGKGWRWPSRR
jgi:hypothetical protein